MNNIGNIKPKELKKGNKFILVGVIFVIVVVILVPSSLFFYNRQSSGGQQNKIEESAKNQDEPNEDGSIETVQEEAKNSGIVQKGKDANPFNGVAMMASEESTGAKIFAANPGFLEDGLILSIFLDPSSPPLGLVATRTGPAYIVKTNKPTRGYFYLEAPRSILYGNSERSELLFYSEEEDLLWRVLPSTSDYEKGVIRGYFGFIDLVEDGLNQEEKELSEVRLRFGNQFYTNLDTLDF